MSGRSHVTSHNGQMTCVNLDTILSRYCDDAGPTGAAIPAVAVSDHPVVAAGSADMPTVTLKVAT
jgi:hypothetical protein